MKKQSIIFSLFVVLLITGGCSTVNFYSLEELSERKIEEISFPVHSADMTVVRSKFVAYAVALYGITRVEKYSGDHTKNDATVIYGRLLSHAGLLKKIKTKYAGQSGLPGTVRVETISSGLRLVGAAVRPTKRYYENQILGILTTPGPAKAVGAAKTAFNALRAVAKVEVYRQAMLSDANQAYHQVVLDAGSATASNGKTPSALFDQFKNTCASNSRKPPLTLKYQVSQFAKPTPWNSYVSPMVKKLICQGKYQSSKRAIKLIRDALRIGQQGGPWANFNIANNAELQHAAGRVEDRLEAVCSELAVLAKLQPGNPCFPK